MDAINDPLARLAAALERMSSASLALSEASERLGRVAPADARDELAAAAIASRRAARTAAAASARASATVGSPSP